MPLPSADLPANLLGACVLGAGGCLLGVLGLLALPSSGRRGERYVLLLALALAGLSGASALLDKPCLLWLPPLAVSAGCLLVQLARLPGCQALASHAGTQAGQAVRLLGHPYAQLGLLTATGSLVVAGLLLPPTDAIPVHHSARFGGPRSSQRVPNRTLQALTDRDAPIGLLLMAPQEVPGQPEDMEQQFVGELARNHQLINSGPADPGHNCHGWVFTGGRYWVDGSDVPRILRDNGYQPVAHPRAGDLVVYRDSASEEVVHTAVVRAVTEEGLVLVESKWGQMGRYIHPPDKLRFANPFRYYRSSRQGHLLRGLEQTGPVG
jgi:hypothetical protein